jgi:hypothetical protein
MLVPTSGIACMHQVLIEQTTQVPTSGILCMHQVLIEQTT